MSSTLVEQEVPASSGCAQEQATVCDRRGQFLLPIDVPRMGEVAFCDIHAISYSKTVHPNGCPGCQCEKI